MTKDEQEALLGYLEFCLIAMVEKNESTLRNTLFFKEDEQSKIIGMMYDEAYEVLNEIERSFNDINEGTGCVVQGQKRSG